MFLCFAQQLPSEFRMLCMQVRTLLHSGIFVGTKLLPRALTLIHNHSRQMHMYVRTVTL